MVAQLAGFAWPEGDWWIICVPGYGTTQAVSRAEIQSMAVDLVATVADVPNSEVSVDIELVQCAAAHRVDAVTDRAAAGRQRALIRDTVRAGLSAALLDLDDGGDPEDVWETLSDELRNSAVLATTIAGHHGLRLALIVLADVAAEAILQIALTTRADGTTT